MQYVVLDMEWNQAWPGSPSAMRAPSLRGEIIQLGAVRMRQGTVCDEFSILIRPHFFRRLNRKVSSLTGIKDARLKEEGVPFREAMALFAAWCGEEETAFLTWGFDDIVILRENLAMYGMPDDWTQTWYNAQMIFNAQTDGASNQKALKSAMEQFAIEPSRPAHDALGDAYHTALVCAKLDLARGTAEYSRALRAHADGVGTALPPGCLARKVYHGYADKREALQAMTGRENRCPHCGGQLRMSSKWYAQQGRRLAAKATCSAHGELILRLKFTPEEQGLRVNRLVYAADSEAYAAFEQLIQKPRPKRRRSRRRARASGMDKPQH